MWLSDEWKDYEVIDTSSGEKLERWGKYILVRPDPQVIWHDAEAAPAVAQIRRKIQPVQHRRRQMVQSAPA